MNCRLTILIAECQVPRLPKRIFRRPLLQLREGLL